MSKKKNHQDHLSEPLEPEPIEPEIYSAEPENPLEIEAVSKDPLAKYLSGKIERLTPLQIYLAEARRHPILTREQELELAKRFREKGDYKSAQGLITSNLRLVVKIALEYQRHWTELLDLIQEGNLGLVQAVRKFDPYRGIRFSTYASFWIRAYILKFLMENYRLVKIGTTQGQRKLFFNLNKEKEKLKALGFNPSLSLLAKNLAVEEKEAKEMDIRLSTPEESLETPISDDGKQTLESTLADDSSEIADKLAEAEFKQMIKNKLEQFRKILVEEKAEKELYIFDHRLSAENPKTLQELGKKFGISRERVRQLEARLLKRLKQFLKQEVPDFEDYEFIRD